MKIVSAPAIVISKFGSEVKILLSLGVVMDYTVKTIYSFIYYLENVSRMNLYFRILIIEMFMETALIPCRSKKFKKFNMATCDRFVGFVGSEEFLRNVE